MITQRTLPKIRDSISFLYFDRCIVEQDANAIAIFQKDTKYQIPCANLSTLLLGPGSRITHAALKTLGKNGCQVHWVGEDGFRFYADGNNTKRSVTRLYHQATLWADPQKRLEVIRAMYQFRFAETLAADLTLQQIRGLEGVRVRNTYAQWSKATGVEWQGRNYTPESWFTADPINRALSSANSYLYAVCQAALTAVGYSPAFGFIHTGKPLSFVYDIADLYKHETTIPAAFETIAALNTLEETTVRAKCREKFSEAKLMRRLIKDVDQVLGYGDRSGAEEAPTIGFLWDDQVEWVEGGQDWLANVPVALPDLPTFVEEELDYDCADS
jgi:CRISP-associated protein Cas1